MEKKYISAWDLRFKSVQMIMAGKPVNGFPSMVAGACASTGKLGQPVTLKDHAWSPTPASESLCPKGATNPTVAPSGGQLFQQQTLRGIVHIQPAAHLVCVSKHYHDPEISPWVIETKAAFCKNIIFPWRNNRKRKCTVNKDLGCSCLEIIFSWDLC